MQKSYGQASNMFFHHYHPRSYIQSHPHNLTPSYAWGRLDTTSTRLAVTVRVVDLVGVILSTEVVVLLGADTLGEHGASQDSRSVLGEVVLLIVGVVVGVDLSKSATDLKINYRSRLTKTHPSIPSQAFKHSSTVLARV